MARPLDRRTFLRVTTASLAFGALHRVGDALAASGPGGELSGQLAMKNGERIAPFSFVQLSDTHVGFQGPPNPTGGTRAFERAVEVVNALPQQPELVLFTGDLTHDTEEEGQRAARMKRFRDIASRLRVKEVHLIPGEHDAGFDGGAVFRDVFGETSYSFDHRGVHFVALDNVSRAKPEVGAERIAWLEKDLARFPATAPIVVFTHRPLFDLRPDWEWFTRDGDQVMRVLGRYENVTVLYGHIHREHVHEEPHSKHFAARSLMWAFPDPDSGAEKKPLPFDPANPFKNLGARVVDVGGRGSPGAAPLALHEVELTLREHSGTEGFQQILRPSSLQPDGRLT